MPLFAPFEPHVRGRQDPDVTIRVATRADAAAVTTVAGCRGPLPVGLARQVAVWADDPARRLVVGELDGVVVGWGMVAPWTDHDDAPHGHYVSALTVLPEARRRGVADRMLSDLCTWTWERDDQLFSVVNARNAASLAVHVRHGFAEVGRGPAYAGIMFEGGEGVLLRATSPEKPHE
jgi:L-amino acid N-acyltransferase YncA